MKKPIAALGQFEIRLPELQMTQADSLETIEQAHHPFCKTPEDSAALGIKLRRFGVKPEQINTRYFETLSLPLRDADILERNRFFSERSFKRFQEFYPVGANPPPHIVHVTCTGYASPSAPQRLVNERDWNRETAITHAYHMGCYAAMPAVRMAEGFIAATDRSVDIVHTELCALHLDGHLHEPEQLVVQTLFADGHIKYSASPITHAFDHGFHVRKIQERIVPGSFEDMSWIPSTQSMRMTLSRDVPSKIGVCLREFVQTLAGDEFASLLKQAVFAVHPGGPKIIDSVREGLELSEEQVATSREILRTRGNMSSATLPHVWKKLLEDGVKGPVISLAFGPGLTIFGAIFDAF